MFAFFCHSKIILQHSFDFSRTYDNICRFKIAICLNPKLWLAHKGECKKDKRDSKNRIRGKPPGMG